MQRSLSKDAKKTSERSELSERAKLQLEFWEKFNEFVKSRDQTFNLRKAYAQHWYSLSVGSSKANISLTIIIDKSLMRCEIYIPDNKSLYYELENEKGVIFVSIPTLLDSSLAPEGKHIIHAFTPSSMDEWVGLSRKEYLEKKEKYFSFLVKKISGKCMN